MNIKRFRTAALALVTILGAADLSTAGATPMPVDRCDDAAAGFAAGFCSGKGHSDWGSVTYSCSGGTVTIHEVECVDVVQ